MAQRKRAKPVPRSTPEPQSARAAPNSPPPTEEGTHRKRKPSVAAEPVALRGARFPVVALGGSAGGLEAFRKFFSPFPAQPGIAFVLVSHSSPNHSSILHELLGASTDVEFRQITDGMRIEENQAYVCPPGHDVTFHNDILRLTTQEAHSRSRPIDACFRSLAHDRGESAVGIVLSGTGSDGTLGIQAIKGALGMTMAQDPNDAQFAGMPTHAIATGMVDLVLPAEGMADSLLGYVRGLNAAKADPSSTVGDDNVLLEALSRVFRRTGHDFAQYKASTILRRIARRMSIHQIEQRESYIRFLDESPAEIDLLFKELLIGVTQFFRDPDAHEALAARVLVDLLDASNDNGPFRVWVPGCSTGEEAYSLAISISEILERTQRRRTFQIFATDLDARAIEVARSARYPEGIGTDVGEERLRKYFTREGDRYRIRNSIRESVTFAEHNLISDPPFIRLDLISCRNVLIYLNSRIQTRIMSLFHYALNPDGALFLGTTETAGNQSSLFHSIDRKYRLFRRVAGPTKGGTLPQQGSTLPPSRDVASTPSPEHKRSTIVDLCARVLSDRFAPPSVIVNDQGDILCYHGQTGQFLQPATGRPNHNLLGMAREGLQLELARSLRRGLRDDREWVAKSVPVKVNGGFQSVDVRVARITHPEALRGLLRVTFDEPSQRLPLAPSPHPPRDPSELHDERDEATLRRELDEARDSLQSTIEQLTASNEDLKSTNEELQSMNEELQSANEELETSKEEMQSLNEELQTVNNELDGRVDLMCQANDDMTNLLNSTDVATIFLDNDLLIKRYTPHATAVVRLIPTDVGRPLSDIVSRLHYDALEKDASEVLATLVFKEVEVQTHDNTWYLMRMVPYRTAENLIDGLVLTFVDISRIKAIEEARSRIEKKYEGIFNATRDALVLVDLDHFTIVEANRQAATLVGRRHDELLSQPITMLHSHWDAGSVYASYSRFGSLYHDKHNLWTLTHSNGSAVAVDAWGTELNHDGGRYSLVQLRDVSDQ